MNVKKNIPYLVMLCCVTNSTFGMKTPHDEKSQETQSPKLSSSLLTRLLAEKARQDENEKENASIRQDESPRRSVSPSCLPAAMPLDQEIKQQGEAIKKQSKMDEPKLGPSAYLGWVREQHHLELRKAALQKEALARLEEQEKKRAEAAALLERLRQQELQKQRMPAPLIDKARGRNGAIFMDDMD